MKVQSAQDQEEDTYSKYSARTYCTYYTMIFKGAHREQNQPVPVRGFKTFCYRALNICSKIRGGAKNNQCHGTVALARWAPLMILDCSFEKNYFRLNPGNRKSDFRHPICHCVLLLYKSKYPTKKAS